MSALETLIAEAQRQLVICNACRYCEGYCAVFPALERRLEFPEGDVHYLANLCHNCGACLYACQYAPPHEFAVSIPRVLAQVRAQSYRKYAWPEAFGRAFERNGTVVGLATALSLAAFLAFTGWFASPARFFAPWSDAEGSFYAVLPHGVMASIFLLVSAFVLVSFLASFVRFWPDMGEETLEFMKAPQLSGAAWDAMGLKYLDGGGDGCTYPDAAPSFARRTFHHLTFYGFLLCFAATSVATIYHYVFGWKAPYPLYSLPVLLGAVGGIGLVIGPLGLMALRGRRDPELVGRRAPGRHGPRIPLAAPLHQRDGPAADGAARDAGDGGAARHTPGVRARALPHAAVRQVRARALPLRGARSLPYRAQTTAAVRCDGVSASWSHPPTLPRVDSQDGLSVSSWLLH
jgi:citrate/tricarballylate utilization protein